MAKRGASSEHSTAGEQFLSVIVPTYNETENIKPLTERLFAAMKNERISCDLIFVDDESQGSAETEKIVKELSEKYPVRIHCRKKVEGRGLSSAVLLGFEKAKHQTILCMDADLQHEPESVPGVAAPVLSKEAEFSVGSRNVEGGGVGFDWSPLRRIVSKGGTVLSWGVAWGATDPMSGFFCTRKDVLERGKAKINPIGFKIGLEIMVRCRAKPVADVAITFRERVAGESKLSAEVYQRYVQQLASLYWDKYGYLLVMLMFFIIFMAVKVLLLMKRMIR